MDNISILKKCFIEVLGIKPSALKDDYSYGTDGWDSVAHMALIAAIESEFEIMIETEDVIDMSSFKIAKKTLLKYGVCLNA